MAHDRYFLGFGFNMTNVLAGAQVIGVEDNMSFCCCHPLVAEAELSVRAQAIGD